MNELPESEFKDPVWHALQTKHRHFCIMAGEARRYPADVAPFAAVANPSTAALLDLYRLLAPGESVWLFGETIPRLAELSFIESLECLQLVLPAAVTPAPPTLDLLRLSAMDAAEMVKLTEIAFPGFFRSRTCDMGRYYGVRIAGELVAMGGERLRLDGYPELSAICTHPAHRGQGFGAAIIWQLARDHRRDALVSWLHVAAANARAIELYRRLGFKIVRKVLLQRLCRAS